MNWRVVIEVATEDEAEDLLLELENAFIFGRIEDAT